MAFNQTLFPFLEFTTSQMGDLLTRTEITSLSQIARNTKDTEATDIMP